MKAARFDVAVIGGGLSGLAAALAADEHGAKTLLIERDANLGGKLKQRIHDENLTGPQYEHRFIREIRESCVETAVSTFVSKVEKKQADFELTLVNREGVIMITCKSVVLACGCRERTPRQIGIHGRHLAGIFTAGTAQYYTNILHITPAKRCVIFGSNNLGLVMAWRLKMEGAEVLGIYEEKPTASHLARNVCRCNDLDIPLYTSKTVTRVFGEERVAAVEVTSVDRNMIPVPGTEEIIECDALILSAGLIPENELAESLGIPLDARTNEPVIDQNYMTKVEGVFCCGNALNVNDPVDYVSESGESAGRAAAEHAETGNSRKVNPLLFIGGSMKHFTCTICPTGCRVSVDVVDGLFRFSGNRCGKAEAFAKHDVFSKTKTETASADRSIITTVRTAFPRIPVLPVRTNRDVPKEKVTEIIRELSNVVITEKIGIGEIVVADVLGTGCDVIAASNILKKILV